MCNPHSTFPRLSTVVLLSLMIVVLSRRRGWATIQDSGAAAVSAVAAAVVGSVAGFVAAAASSFAFCCRIHWQFLNETNRRSVPTRRPPGL